jgi:imidazolonepropionase-like amidohydrolase
MTKQSSGVANRVAKSLSNVASGSLEDPVYGRAPIPPWDVGSGESLLLTNVNVVNVDQGSLFNERNVLARDQRIVDLVRPDDLDAARSRFGVKREIDCGGHYLIPGLSDIHCHVSLVSEFGVGIRQLRHLDSQRLSNSEAALRMGCTFIRDCGAALAPINFIRAEIDADRLLGPRIMTSTNSISPRGGMWDVGRAMNKLAEPLFGGRLLHLPDGPDELVRAMTEINSYGCDFFKTYFEERPLYGGKQSDVFTMFTPEEARLIRDTADRFGKKVSAHTMFISGSRRAIEAGIDIVDHCTVDEPYLSEDADKMAEQGTVIVPTLSLGMFMAMNCGSRGYRDDPEVRYFAEQRNNHARRHAQSVPVPQLKKSYERFFDWLDERQDDRKMPMVGPVWPERVHGFARHAPESIERLRSAGVKVGVGTDGGTGITFCGHLEVELQSLRRYGYSNAEALRMATLGNMEIVGRSEDLGSIEKGKRADMVLLDDNPLQNLNAISGVLMVFKSGRLYHESSLA